MAHDETATLTGVASIAGLGAGENEAMNMISQLRRQVAETGEATIGVPEFNQLQAEWIKRSMDKDTAKKMATDFFRWWHNQPGANTDQGFDEWWDKFHQSA